MRLRLLIISILLAGYLYPQSFDWDWFSKKKETGVFTPVFAGDTTFPFNSIYDSGYVYFGENNHFMDFIRVAGTTKFINGVYAVTDSIVWQFRVKLPQSVLTANDQFMFAEYQSAWQIDFYINVTQSFTLYVATGNYAVWNQLTESDTNWHTYRAVLNNKDSTMKTYTDGVLVNAYTGKVPKPPMATYPLQFNCHALGFGDGEASGILYDPLFSGKFMLDYFYIDKWFNGTDSLIHWDFNEGIGEYAYNNQNFLKGDRDDNIADTNKHFGHIGFSSREIDSCNPTWHSSSLKRGYEDIVYQVETGTHVYIPLTTGQFDCFFEQWGMRGDTMTINDTLNVLMCGAFNRINATIPPYSNNGDTAPSFYRWNGAVARRIGSATFFTNVVYKAGHWGDTIYAGGSLAGQRLVQYKPNTANWVSVGTEPNGDVYAMFVDTTDNTLIIGGGFTTAGGLGIARIAKWNGASYDTMGVMNSPVWSIIRYNGFIYAGTSNGLKKYNGTTWEECGGNSYGVVYNINIYQNKLWCFGNFRPSGGTTWGYDIWNGSAFEHPAGVGLEHFYILPETPNATWSAVAPNGRDLYVIGSFYSINGVACNKIARWNGREWSAVVMGGANLRTESCFMWKDQYNNIGQGANYYYMAVMGDQLAIGGEDCHGIGLIKIPQDTPIADAGAEYDVDATALFARFSVQPNATNKGYMDSLIIKLKRDTLWTKYDALYVFAISTNKNDALLNWKGNVSNCTFGIEPTWTVYEGFTTTGTEWLNSNYNPSTFGGVYTQDNASLSLYMIDTGMTTSGSDCGSLGTAYTVMITHAGALDRFYADINTTSDVFTNNAFSYGLLTGSRISGTDVSFYRNGILLENKANASTGLTDHIFYIGCRNDGADSPQNYNSNTYAIVRFGSGLTDYQAQMEATDFNEYMISIGKNVY